MNRQKIKIKAGLAVFVLSTVMAVNFILPTYATDGNTSTPRTPEEEAELVRKEHPNVPDGRHIREPLVSTPPSYEGHVHQPIPFVNGKLALNMDRIDRTNSQIEFSIDKSWLGERKIKRIGFGAIRWYGFVFLYPGKYEDSKFDREWTTNIYTNKVDYGELADRHESKDRYFWIMPTFDLFYEWSNDIVYVVQFEDGVYYNGRVSYEEGCMHDWLPGDDCRAITYDETKEELNVDYRVHKAPSPYVKGMTVVSRKNGYMNDDLKAEDNNQEPKEDSNSVTGENGGTVGGENNSGNVTNPGSGDNSGSNNLETPDEKQKTPEPAKQDDAKSNQDQEPKQGQVITNERLIGAGVDEEVKEDKVLFATEVEDGDRKSGVDSEIDEETTIDTIDDEKDTHLEEKEEIMKEQNPSEVPKLGDVKSEKNLFNLWWLWFTTGIAVGAILYKTFLSMIHAKKNKVSE